MALEVIPGIIALLLQITLPGYFLALGIFPSKKSLEGLERALLSIVLSITAVPLVLLLLNQLLFMAINLASVLGTDIFLIALGIAVYHVRTGSVEVPKAIYKIMPKIEKGEAVEIVPRRR